MDDQRIPVDEARWAAELAKRVRRSNPGLAIVVSDLIQGRAAEAPAGLLSYVIQHTSTRRWRERHLAVWAMGLATSRADRRETLLLLLPLLRSKNSEDSVGHGAVNTCLSGFAVSALLSTAFFMAYEPYGGPISPIGLALFACFGAIPASLALAPIVIPLTVHLERSRHARLRVLIADALARLQTPVSVASLAFACMDRSPEVRAAAKKALLCSIGLVKPEQYGKLGIYFTPTLCKMLLVSDEELALTAVKGLRAAGTGASVAPMERAASRSPSVSVRAAIEAALPILRERQRQEQDAGRLLRSSDAPPAPDDILLRSVLGSTESDEATLLRIAET